MEEKDPPLPPAAEEVDGKKQDSDRKQKKSDRKRKKDKKRFVDDGRVVADMNIEGTPWYRGKNFDKGKEVPKLTRKERFAVFCGAVRSMIVPVLCTVAGLIAAILLVWLWLK